MLKGKQKEGGAWGWRHARPLGDSNAPSGLFILLSEELFIFCSMWLTEVVGFQWLSFRAMHHFQISCSTLTSKVGGRLWKKQMTHALRYFFSKCFVSSSFCSESARPFHCPFEGGWRCVNTPCWVLEPNMNPAGNVDCFSFRSRKRANNINSIIAEIRRKGAKRRTISFCELTVVNAYPCSREGRLSLALHGSGWWITQS